jgi:protein required for attachment to host cells
MKATTTFVLVIDGGRAKVFRNDGPGRGLEPVEDMARERVGGHHARDLGSDRPGRGFAKAGAHARHSFEPKVPLNRAEEHTFFAEVVAALEAARRAKRFNRLVVVAPPRVLGEIRDLMPKTLDSTVLGEVRRDLTRAKLADVTKHVGACIAV